MKNFNETKISEIQFIPVKPKNGLLGFVSFVIDEKLWLGSIAVFTKIDGSGYRLVYPTKKVGERTINIFHPINQEAGKAIEEVVTKKVSEIFSETYEGVV